MKNAERLVLMKSLVMDSEYRTLLIAIQIDATSTVIFLPHQKSFHHIMDGVRTPRICMGSPNRVVILEYVASNVAVNIIMILSYQSSFNIYRKSQMG